MRATEIDATYYDPANDQYAIQHIDDTRKPRLTLIHLNRLKKMRAARQLENLVRRDTLDLLYGGGAEEAGGVPGI
jgi:hypothetical protein